MLRASSLKKKAASLLGDAAFSDCAYGLERIVPALQGGATVGGQLTLRDDAYFAVEIGWAG